jgi:hypothetical protein
MTLTCQQRPDEPEEKPQLSELEQEQLNRLARRQRASQHLRASIILKSAEGQNDEDISRLLELPQQEVEFWRQRWLALSRNNVSITKRLEDPRRYPLRQFLCYTRQFLCDVLNDPYYKFEDCAKSIKILLQMIVGVFLVFSLGVQIYVAFTSHTPSGHSSAADSSQVAKKALNVSQTQQTKLSPTVDSSKETGNEETGNGIVDFWGRFKSRKLLDIIADGLLMATAIELGYMFFTDGPDEAINPPLIALAAAVLFRLPDALTDNGLKRALEVAIYVLLITLLLAVRARFLDNELKRKKEKRKNKEQR